ncbi:oxygen sensor histidine kinase NreB [Enterococcus florum]|uniref:histidine kinase n=1 Tax=Enterococcus florum TaxID=2480627 RepID=A0A4P5PB45_9ENTE|nr:sensor histidine kinase [Enterococcus florum]GCF95385.1 oxygen sensor histidine kinase NreB [Enterococcus florum]
MLQLDNSLFQTIQEPIWVIDQKGQQIAKTHMAEEIETNYRFKLQAVLDISRGKGCALHSTKEECLNCPLEGNLSPSGFPFVLLSKEERPEEFWGRVDENRDQLILQIRNKTNVDSQDSLFEYLNNVRELERKKIAQDLHDGIAQSVYGLMLETRGLKWVSEAQRARKMQLIDQHFTEVLKEIKDLAGELRPMAIDEFGLVQALEQFIERTREMTGFEIDLIVLGVKQPLTEAVRISIYRIVQEAASNAMKYSGENSLELILDFKDEALLVRIRDQGKGFDLIQHESGFGLVNMKERAHSIGSHLTVDSKRGQGTVVQMQIPLKEGQTENEHSDSR